MLVGLLSCVTSDLVSYADDIESMTYRLTLTNVERSCREILKLNRYLNSTFNRFLVIFHAQYFPLLVAQIPSVSSRLQCGEGGNFFFLCFAQLHIFLMVTSRTDLVEKTFGEFQRKVVHLTMVQRSDETILSLGQRLGLEVDIGFKSVLCWKRCFSSLSFRWSFAFMAFQLAITATPWSCWE